MENTKYTPSTAQQLTELFTRYAPHIKLSEETLSQLIQAMNAGHSYIHVDEQEQQTLEKATPIAAIAQAAPLVLQGNKLFSGRVWDAEKKLAAQIFHRVQQETAPVSTKSADRLQQWFQGEGSQDQQAAAAFTLLKNFSLISGGPGTGKTTVVAKLLALLCFSALENNTQLPIIALAAPTGKAAARMSEALKNEINKIENLPENIAQHLLTLQGQTIHRLLKLMPPQMQAKFNTKNTLPLNVLVLDEASMFDTHLLLQTLNALPKDCRVILLGDAEQLPSIGIGAVLAQLCKLGELDSETKAKLKKLLPRESYPTLYRYRADLTISHRFNDKSAIGELARSVLSNNNQNAWLQFQRFPEKLHICEGNAQKQASDFFQKQQDYWAAIDKQNIQQAFIEHSKYMVLAAQHHEANQFNQAYCKLLQQKKRASEQGWFEGQIIMINRNDPAQNIYNGDIGIIMKHQGELFAYFAEGETYRPISVSRLGAHETAFAITVHKSQGSQYQNIWLLAPQKENENSSDNKAHFNRALLYTAITRARDSFTYWGKESDFQAACRNKQNRLSALAEFIQKEESKQDKIITQ